MTALIILVYLFPCVAVAMVFGAARTIGFWYTLFFCIFLTPVVGFFITLFYKTKENDKRQKEAMALQREQLELMKSQHRPYQPAESLPQQLERLFKMKDAGQLTDAEFEAAKEKLLSQS